ncbi:E3 ubiquitin-protein ligase TTC3 isoform X3 [Hippocampus comes]|uniref:E3 ubiquitin-protein ligase TTC3 isoform X3 n=1 Tax=Hippocampus comes TaxID=109280 RepID=UPI00094F0976|nr:PREDICTED: E3 ubiquitin-protein ligase TTC3 isoform X3 [Hippocampus comes]
MFRSPRSRPAAPALVVSGSGQIVDDRSGMAAISDPDSEYTDCVGDWVKNGTFFEFETLPKLHPGHLPISINKDFDSWLKIPVNVKKEADIQMRLSLFWMPILLNVDAMSVSFHWAMNIGLLNAHDPAFVSLETLRKIETIEAILRALEAAAYFQDQLPRLASIHNSFYEQSPEALKDAMEWLEQSGEPDMRSRVEALAHQALRHSALGFIFHQYMFYIHMMGMSVCGTMMELQVKPHEDAQAASEYHKKVGNNLFQEEKYQGAAFEYTIAVRFNPENHIAFSNRALCHTRRQNYLDAAVDAKRATLIEPSYTKGHYRYCEALFLLGEVQWAVSANKEARFLCAGDRAGIKDLEQQNLKFVSKNPKGGKGKKAGPCKKKTRAAETIKETQNSIKPEDTNNSTVVETQRLSRESDGNGSSNNNHINGDDMGNGVCKVNKQNRPVEDRTAGAKESPKTSKKKSTASKDNWDSSPDRSQSPRGSLSDVLKMAHTSLIKQCYYNADTFFRQAASLVNSFTSDQKKIIGFSALDMQLVLYGRVSALTEIGKPQEFAEARKLLEEIKSYKERGFRCLVSYGCGRIYLKEKKFAAALEQFEDSLQMVRNRITPGKLTWPQTTDIVRETDLDLFQEILEDSIYACKFPPPPDGTCRYEDCLAPSKNIYITDPDFKGFVEFKCSQKCIIEYHSACWKALKPPSFDKCEKPCPTPDCSGVIDSIKVIDATGLIKHVQGANARAESPRKVKVNQKPPTGVKKLKEKNHGKKEENTKTKQTSENKASVSDDLPLPKTVTAAQAQQKAWWLYQDRVLVQVSQMMQLLRQEKGLAASDVSRCLKPWLELDSARGNRLAAKMLDWERERLETLDQAAELLLQRKNRVWARAFIQLLSNTLNINADLSRWAGRLDDADLKAAKSFVERNADHLDELDLSPLLTFAPLKEIISDHDPPGADLTSSNLTKYVKWAPPHEMRLFIWTLEEHKDVNISLNNLLDEYFVCMIDGHCSVLKKSGNQNSFPASNKSRGRRKKKEPQVLPFICGWENDAADEWDQEEPMYRYFLDPDEPFSIPHHLRTPIAQFEEQYYGTGRTREAQRILDNNPDFTVENLYEYFAQVLEEHGPLPADDPLLRGEIENFPPVAQAKIQQAGGLERFLLQSLRFSDIGGRVGLAKWAAALQAAARLDLPQPPHVFSSGANLRNAEPYITFDMDKLLPPIGKGPVNNSGCGKLSPNPFRSLDLSAGQVDEAWETYSDTSDLSLTPAKAILKKHAEVQTYQAVKDCVAVNTEPLQPYESLQGDINKRVKRIQEMGQQISKIAHDRELVDQKHQMTLASLEKDIQEISTNIKVTDKEMSLFQQKLEEEVKRDQKEKKANQEVLKALKIETEKLVEEGASFSKQIRANKTSYDEKLNRFLDLSNQSAAEKMSLEDEIKRCRNSIAAAHRRSRSAQLSMLESSRDQRLYGLRARLADAKTLQLKLDKCVQHGSRHFTGRYPSLEASRQNMGGKIQELEQKIAALEIQYKDHVEQVKRGQEVKELLGSHQTDPQVSLLSSDVAALSVVLPPPPQSTVAAAQAAAAETRNVAGPTQAAGNTVLDKAVESLGTIFPEYTRSDLMKFFKDLRSANGGSLSNMSLQDVVSAVSQLILDQKEAIASGATSTNAAAGAAAAPPPVEPSSIWQKSRDQPPLGANALNLEDPCAICHEEMSPPHCLVLECRHAFHEKCIASWLKDSSTCPNCRKETRFKDFPVLPGRRRQAP